MKSGDEDYKDLILSDYTFFKRPVIQFGNTLFIGNDAKTKENIRKILG